MLLSLVSPRRATIRKVGCVCFCRSRPISPHPLEKAKGHFETQRLGLCVWTLSGTVQAARFFPFFCPWKHRSAGCSRCGWGCILQGSRGTDTGEGGRGLYGWMDRTDWVGLGWALVGLLELLRSLVMLAPDFSPPDFFPKGSATVQYARPLADDVKPNSGCKTGSCHWISAP